MTTAISSTVSWVFNKVYSSLSWRSTKNKSHTPTIESQFEPQCKWRVNDKEITLLRKGDNMGYEIKDCITRKAVNCKLESSGNSQSIIECIEYFKQRTPVLNGAETEVDFLAPIYRWTITPQNESVSVFKDRNCLIFQVFKNNVTIQVRFDKVKIQFTKATCDAAKTCFNSITPSIAEDEIRKIYNLFELKKIEDADPRFWRIFDRYMQLYFEPKSVPHDFDGRIRVSPFLWGVTMTCNGVSTNINSRINGLIKQNHAQIAVEGIDAHGRPFKYYADFGDEGVRAHQVSKVTCTERTPPYKMPATTVEAMMKAIDNEKGKPQRFTYCGIYSWITFGRGHNCFTWAIDKLRMVNIDWYKPHYGWLVTTVRSWTRPEKDFKFSTHPTGFPQDPNIDKL